MKTPPPIQKLRIIVSSIAPQFEAMSVHHHGVHTWNTIDPIITAKKQDLCTYDQSYKIKGRINLGTKCLIKDIQQGKNDWKIGNFDSYTFFSLPFLYCYIFRSWSFLKKRKKT